MTHKLFTIFRPPNKDPAFKVSQEIACSGVHEIWYHFLGSVFFLNMEAGDPDHRGYSLIPKTGVRRKTHSITWKVMVVLQDVFLTGRHRCSQSQNVSPFLLHLSHELWLSLSLGGTTWPTALLSFLLSSLFSCLHEQTASNNQRELSSSFLATGSRSGHLAAHPLVCSVPAIGRRPIIVLLLLFISCLFFKRRCFLQPCLNIK